MAHQTRHTGFCRDLPAVTPPEVGTEVGPTEGVWVGSLFPTSSRHRPSLKGTLMLRLVSVPEVVPSLPVLPLRRCPKNLRSSMIQETENCNKSGGEEVTGLR